MKHAISISLGSASRNKKVTISLNGEKVIVERIGTQGDEKVAQKLFKDMDGKVDALGVGGVELYIRLGDEEYPLRSGLNLVKGVHKTPVVDGRGLKHTLERQVMQHIQPQLDTTFSSNGPKKAMMTLGVDRFGMAQSLVEAGYDTVFCDFMFGLGLPIPVYGLKNLKRMGKFMLPVVGLLPISMVYSIGDNQEEIVPKYANWFAYGSIIAGDFLYIRRHLPASLKGQMVVTNTTTAADVSLLRERGLNYLVTTTPVFEGRSFGTNMLEAALTAYAGQGRPLTTIELTQLIAELDIKPTLQKLN